MSVWHWLILLMVISFTILLACGLVLAVWQKGPGSAEAASWMQAIGSIGAILGAFGVSWYQQRKSETAARDAKLLEKIDLLKTMHEIAIMGKSYIDRAHLAFSGDAKSMRAYFADEHSKDDFDDVADAIAQIPLYSMPGRAVFAGLIGVKRAMEKVFPIVDVYSSHLSWIDEEKADCLDKMKFWRDYVNDTVEHIKAQMLALQARLSSAEIRGTAFEDIQAPQAQVSEPSVPVQ